MQFLVMHFIAHKTPEELCGNFWIDRVQKGYSFCRSEYLTLFLRPESQSDELKRPGRKDAHINVII